MKFLFFIISVSFSFVAFSKDYEIKITEHQAYDYFVDADYVHAKPLYKRLYEFDHRNFMYNYPLGVCYLYEKNDSSLYYLQKCISHRDTLTVYFDYYLAKAFHLNDKFDEAKTYYTSFLSRTTELSYGDIESYKRSTALAIKQCAVAVELLKTPRAMTVENMGDKINSSGHEYGPLMNYDERFMIYTSERKRDESQPHLDAFGRYYEDVYVVQKKKGKWQEPFRLKNVNTNGEDAALFYSHSGNELLIYRYSRDASFHPYSGNIYHTTLMGDSVGNVMLYPEPINTKYRESSACLSSDGSRIYFSSNRPGGFGGMDLYYCYKKGDTTWSPAINLGKGINTAYDEDSPFLTPDKLTLFYCSNGEKSIGGFDFFMSHKDLSTMNWQESENLGFPLNTAHDDLYLEYSAYSNSIFFSAERHIGYGGEDVYHAILEENLINKVHKCKLKVESSLGKDLSGTLSLAIDQISKMVGVYTILPNGEVEIFISDEHDYFLLISLKNKKSKLVQMAVDVQCTDQAYQAINIDDCE